MDKKEEIYKSAIELFHSKGYKNTNISDISKMAGIGVGTFYNFYPSKEKLFLEIFQKENEKLRKDTIETINLDDDPMAMINKYISAINSSPILMEWYNRDIFSKLEQQYDDQNGFENEDFTDQFYKELIKKWKADGKIRNDIDDQMIFAFFNSLAYLDNHKREIGIQYFPQIIIYLAEFIMKGLTDNRK